jgi:hypothetical protein
MRNDIETGIRSLLTKKSPRPDALTAKLYQAFKEEITNPP